MNKEIYTNIRNKSNYTLQEIHLILNKYRNIISNLDISLKDVEDIVSRGLVSILQRILPKVFTVLDKHYNIISIIKVDNVHNKSTILYYLTNNHTTQE